MSSTTQLCLAVSLGLLLSSVGSHIVGQPLMQPVPMVAPAGPIGIELPMTATLVRSTPFPVGQTTRTLVIPVDYARQAHVSVVIPSQGGAVTLTRPDNQVVTATNAASLGAEWTQIDGTAPLAALFSPDPQWTLVSITLPSTAPAGWPAGEYSLSITVPQPLTAIRHSVATVEFRTAIVAGFAMLDSAVTTGQPVGVGILVRDPRGGVPSLAVTAASVEVTAVGPAGTTPVTVQATDDGLNGDVAANDGLYTVAFSPPAAGRWSLVATVTGMTPGSAAQPVSVPFARTVFGEIDAAPAAARFAVASAAGAEFNDSAVDDQGDSLFDRIVIGRGVVVDAAGAGQKYRLELTLRTALGVELTARGTPTTLAAGTPLPHTLTADLLGTDVWAVQESGPFQVVSARLYGTYALPAPPGGGTAPSTGGTEVLLDTLVPTAPATSLHATAAYNLSDAQRRPIRLGPVGNPITADTTSPPNGKFDTLTIPMGLKVPRAGLYRYRAALRDVVNAQGLVGCNRAFVWTEGTIEVAAADVETQLTINLVFDGATIGRYGSPAPWALGEVVVWRERGTDLIPCH